MYLFCHGCKYILNFEIGEGIQRVEKENSPWNAFSHMKKLDFSPPKMITETFDMISSHMKFPPEPLEMFGNLSPQKELSPEPPETIRNSFPYKEFHEMASTPTKLLTETFDMISSHMKFPSEPLEISGNLSPQKESFHEPPEAIRNSFPHKEFHEMSDIFHPQKKLPNEPPETFDISFPHDFSKNENNRK